MIAPAVWILINLVTKPRPLIKLDREIAIIYGIVHIIYYEQSSDATGRANGRNM